MQGSLKFLTETQHAKLASGMEHGRFRDGQIILEQGERRRALFFLTSGRVRVERQHMQFSVEISKLEPGDVFGEMSFVDEEGASARVVAEGPAEVDIANEAQIAALIREDAEFYGRFYRSLAAILSRRLRETTLRTISEYSWGGYGAEAVEQREPSDSDWGGGSPLREL